MLPAVFAVGPVVEVWADVTDYREGDIYPGWFLLAHSAWSRHRAALGTWHAGNPGVRRTAASRPWSWSIEKDRPHAEYYLRKLAAAGATPDDLPALRVVASRLVRQPALGAVVGRAVI